VIAGYRTNRARIAIVHLIENGHTGFAKPYFPMGSPSKKRIPTGIINKYTHTDRTCNCGSGESKK
jgi:hypothetical protein